MQSIAHAARSLAKSPGFTLVAVLTIGIGIGASTTLFTLIQGVLRKPLPYEEPERLVRFWSTWTQFPRGSISEPEFFDYVDQNRSFEHLTIYQWRDLNLVLSEGDPRRVSVVRATGDFLPVFGREAAFGRTLTPDDAATDAELVAVASYGFWLRVLGAKPEVVGSLVELEGETFRIVGVMPPDFRYPDSETELWTAARLDRATLAHREAHTYNGIARLNRETSLSQAQADMSGIAARLQEEYPDSYPENSGWGVVLLPLLEYRVGPVRPALLVLFVAVIFLLLIACANVANLTLVRSVSRQKDLALRSVLGAGRRRLVTGLLWESIWIAAAGLALGLVLSLGALRVLIVIAPEGLPRLQDASIDWQVALFSVAIATATTVLIGLLPALRASDPELLKQAGRSTSLSAQGRLRNALSVVQIALAATLLVGSGLLLKSLDRLLDVEPGFEPENVLALQMSLGRDRYAEPEQRARFYRDAVRVIDEIPSVVAVGATTMLPLSGYTSDNYIEVPGYEPPEGYATEQIRSVTPGFFAAAGIPLLEGGTFSGTETGESAATVIVSESFARKYWVGEDAIGKRFRMGSDDAWMSVIGVVGDVRQTSLSDPVLPTYYVPHPQRPERTMSLIIRTATDPEAVTSQVRAAISNIDPLQPVFNAQLLSSVVSDSVARPRFSSRLLSIFSFLALMLATVGIYSVLAFSVGQRTREIGIRMALGARRADVPWLVLRQGVRILALGLTIGFLGVLGLGRFLESMLFGVRPFELETFGVAALVLVLVAIAASGVPARRAAQLDPIVALRHE